MLPPLAALLLIFAAGCTAPGLHARRTTAPVTPWSRSELFCETDVTSTAWKKFLDEVVLPRFPRGVTVIEGYRHRPGEAPGAAVRRPVRILVIEHPDDAVADRAVEEIRCACRLRFGGDLPLRTDTPAAAAGAARTFPVAFHRLGAIRDPRLPESSGLAWGWRNPGILWTHNDSGGRPRIFALHMDGSVAAVCRIAGAHAVDWEDIAAMPVPGGALLFIGDFGDNRRKRSSYHIYVVAEPELDSHSATPPRSHTLPLVADITFRYPDGPHDTEALAVDPRERCILLCTKASGRCGVYRLPLDLSAKPDAPVLVAQPVASLRLPRVTGMDLSADGRRLILVTYGVAFLFGRNPGEDWSVVFSRTPRHFAMPPRRQGESICFDPAGMRAYLTSEILPAPLWEVFLPLP